MIITLGEPDIVERKIGNTRVELQQKRQRLANTTSGTQDSDFGVLLRTQ